VIICKKIGDKAALTLYFQATDVGPPEFDSHPDQQP
jgi:hypothetical protein